MYLTSREQALVADIFKVLADSLPEHELRREVGRRLLDLLNADYLASYVWDDERERFANRVALNMSDDNLSGYEQYYQYRDSLTPRLQRYQTAVRVTDVIPQEELAESELFNDFLRRDGLHWGLNLFAWFDGENIGDLRIWRGEHRDNFSDHELALLELVRPAFTVALARARDDTGIAKAADEPPPEGPGGVFGRLTRREREVVELVVEGLLDKEIAQRLGISYTTVRTHLDRSFQKLGVSNRSRLARLVRSTGG
ncbi:response regulator transcription factor [Paraburkholderia caballeronis]|uniref:Regulatory protein, luxR family n=1 Tax=Paraburkholderia caballeronis TaxID=416943 RepID=A0A1H7NVL7_9BURK|nr:helix-turn-helix transcriptional regulator [Paraburkholderia caballeronis]PXW25510.1 regulatory LuxR family protein [Paraburkholderia caballeronis]PXX01117.1 regulatory LuxR family protein [Paraburkholderia caballeronis]RAJ99530.1 regulatory LuxR family protein [Paraburkholderia caballeronis]SEE34422.1 regulatory protein, luxR family [Paraburkholderia caballeronis]SEL27561.1 regulatory protein, luxR family [Paraburkholderia caballeronis]